MRECLRARRRAHTGRRRRRSAGGRPRRLPAPSPRLPIRPDMHRGCQSALLPSSGQLGQRWSCGASGTTGRIPPAIVIRAAAAGACDAMVAYRPYLCRERPLRMPYPGSPPAVDRLSEGRRADPGLVSFASRSLRWARNRAGVAQLAERQPSKLNVAGSNPVSRSISSSSGGDAPPDRAATQRRASIAVGALGLRRALARTIRPGPSLTANAAALSSGYRSGAVPADAGGHVHDAASARAYAAARMPATYAACGRAMAAAADRLPGFHPTRVLDVGAGTGAASWAAISVWPSLAGLTLVAREPAPV